jgi:fermentation-respiration switch protein FrsA (DUF1100 family)
MARTEDIVLRTVGLLILPCVILLNGCSGLFFYPAKPWLQNPANQGLAYEDVVLIHEKGLRLHGWWLPSEGRPKGTVYFLHGNAENISTHLMNVAWLPKAGYQVFLLDYRGYGLSEGEAALPQVFSDIQLGLDWLENSGRLGNAPLIVFGQSLGAAMTAKVLAEKQNRGLADCVMLESVFSGYDAITRSVMSRSWLLWPFQWPVAAAMPDRWDPQDHIAGLEGTPLLILHSKEDEIIPFEQGRAVYEAAREPKVFQPLKGRHIGGTRDPAVQERMLKFVTRFCPPPAQTNGNQEDGYRF